MSTPDQLKHQQARQQERDLDWCLSDADLLQSQYVKSIASVDYESLKLSGRVTNKPRPLLQAKKRLGLYFEQLWQHLISQHFNQVIVAANRQINHAGTTLGALDVLAYSPERETYIHYEMAVKFYLAFGPGDNLAQWIGPNSRDRLDLKLNRLLKHQLPLAHDARAREQIDQWLVDKNMPSIESTGLQQQLILKGWLFQHGDEPPTSVKNSVFLNERCTQGLWLHFNEVSDWLAQSNLESEIWLVLPRLLWLSSAQIHENAVKRLSSVTLNVHEPLYLDSPILLTTEELKNLIRAQGQTLTAQAILVAQVRLEDGYWSEQQRIMWVNNYWPESTTRSARPSRNK